MSSPADGLSQTELNNFASWSGEGSVSGSELLAGIAGATGVLFYDGDSWQHYGVRRRTGHPWLARLHHPQRPDHLD